MSLELALDVKQEELKIKKLLKNMDTCFYYKIIENRQSYIGRYFPHRGETGSLFMNTYQYVSIGDKKEKKE